MEKTADLDQILRDVGGFGCYQIKRFILVALLLGYAAVPTFSFIFTTIDVKHRCFVEGCDDAVGPSPNFDAEWASLAIPFKGNEPRKCLRYVNPFPYGNCTGTFFNKTTTVRCDRFVYERHAKLALANEFGIECEEDQWLLSLVGTINNLGFLLGLPLAGFLSDRYGRLKIMYASVISSVTLGMGKSFAGNFATYATLEFLETFLGGGTYGAGYILGMELLTSEQRVIGSTIMSSAFAVGEALMGFLAWYTDSWRDFLRLMYGPAVVFFAYYWLLDESLRWLMANERKVDAVRILRRIAKENKCDKMVQILGDFHTEHKQDIVKEVYAHKPAKEDLNSTEKNINSKTACGNQCGFFNENCNTNCDNILNGNGINETVTLDTSGNCVIRDENGNTSDLNKCTYERGIADKDATALIICGTNGDIPALDETTHKTNVKSSVYLDAHDEAETPNDGITNDSFVGVLKSRVLSARLVNCTAVWICCVFVYFGLTMHSVGISGNVYVNYAAVALIEIPAYAASSFSLRTLGRRNSLAASLLLSGFACIGFVFTPESDVTLRLALFLLGKFSATVSFSSVYLHTAEMFPTSLRHSVVSLCAGFSRIGSMICPQVLLTARLWKSLPTIIFGAAALSAGLLSLIFPETLHTKLPDNIREAEDLGTHE